MLRRLSAHSPRESGERRMCCSSWQILHLFSVSVEPGPEISRSCACAPNPSTAKRTAATLRLNHHSDAVPAVPEVAERIPRRHGGLRVARVVPRAREEGDVACALGLVFMGEGTPGVFVAPRPERRVAPSLPLVGRYFDA